MLERVSTIEDLLSRAGGHRRPGASESQIASAEHRLGVRLPDDLRAFLRWSNGWEDEFGETWLVLDGTEEISDRNDSGFREAFPGYVAFGGNGGLETYALHCPRGDIPTAVVAIDRNSASAEDIWRIAPSVTDALARLLDSPAGPWEADENDQP
jgi:hypothetical protein